MKNESSNVDWPAWLVGDDAGISESLARISTIHDELRKLAAKPYVHRKVLPWPVQAVVAALEEVGVVEKNPKGGTKINANRFKGFTIPNWFSVSTVTQMAEAHGTLGHLSIGNLITVVRLLDAFKLCTASGDFLVPLIALRSLFEHIAALHSVLVMIRQKKTTGASESTAKLLMNIGEEISKRTYGTRVDWDNAIFSPSDAALAAKAVKYKPKPESVDRTAKQVLNALDELDEAVEGTRSVYEILCEFAHPNVGTMVISTEKRGPEADEQDVLWNEHVMRSGPPVHFVRATGELVPRVLKQTAACLEHYARTRAEAEDARHMLLGLGQVLVREFVANDRARFAPYSICPCGSGKKLKFCCGK